MGKKPHRTRLRNRVDLKGRSFKGIRKSIVDERYLDLVLAKDEQKAGESARSNLIKLEEADLKEVRLGISEWKSSGSKERG